MSKPRSAASRKTLWVGVDRLPPVSTMPPAMPRRAAAIPNGVPPNLLAERQRFPMRDRASRVAARGLFDQAPRDHVIPALTLFGVPRRPRACAL